MVAFDKRCLFRYQISDEMMQICRLYLYSASRDAVPPGLLTPSVRQNRSRMRQNERDTNKCLLQSVVSAGRDDKLMQ